MSTHAFASLIARILPKTSGRTDLERAYLEDSASLYDLECREREIERGKFAPVFYGAVTHPAPAYA